MALDVKRLWIVRSLALVAGTKVRRIGFAGMTLQPTQAALVVEGLQRTAVEQLRFTYTGDNQVCLSLIPKEEAPCRAA